MRHIVFALSLLMLNACLQAQGRQGKESGPEYEVVLPGSDKLDAATVRPHRIRYEKRGAFMIYDLAGEKRGDRDLYRLHVYFNKEEGTPDTMVFDRQTLGFVGRRLEAKDYIVDIGFDQGRLSGGLEPTEGSDYSPRTYDKAHPHGGFEPAMMNYWMAALPLAEGLRVSIPLFDLSNVPDLSWADIEVLGRETLKVEGKSYDTWKVRSTNGKRVKTVWISPEVPYALKMALKGSAGAWIAKP